MEIDTIVNIVIGVYAPLIVLGTLYWLCRRARAKLHTKRARATRRGHSRSNRR